MIRSRERSSNAENRRKQVFETFIARESSQFERMKMKTAVNNEKKMKSKIKNVIHRADSALERERERERRRERRRVSIIAVEREENLLSAVDEEEREREQRRDRERSRSRERRDREQAASK
jgi:hypothetical protein